METMPRMNAHEAPPQDLKNVFKSWKGSLTPERENILDFTTRAVRMPSLKHEHLLRVFKNFSMHAGGDADQVFELNANFNSCGMIYSFEEIEGLLILPSLLPPVVQKSLLCRMLHRDLSDPKHKTNLHLHYDVQYPIMNAPFFSADPSVVSFHPKDAKVHSPVTNKQALEKKLRWVTLGGQYDWTNKVYPDVEPPEFPSDIAGLLQGLFPEMEPQAGIVNLYSPRDTLSLHRDVSEEVDRGLVSISLGCDAIFIVGIWDSTSEKTRHLVLRLKSGDALYMSGESRFAWHGVPKVIAGTCPEDISNWPGEEYPLFKDWMSNKRINLNVRQMRDSNKDLISYNDTQEVN